MRGKVNQQYIKDVQSGQLKCTKFRRALLSAIQYIQTMNDAWNNGSTSCNNLDNSSTLTSSSTSTNFNSTKGINKVKLLKQMPDSLNYSLQEPTSSALDDSSFQSSPHKDQSATKRTQKTTTNSDYSYPLLKYQTNHTNFSKNTNNEKVCSNTTRKISSNVSSNILTENDEFDTEFLDTSLNVVDDEKSFTNLIDPCSVHPVTLHQSNQHSGSNLSSYSSRLSTSSSRSSSIHLNHHTMTMPTIKQQQNHLVVPDDDDENETFDFNLQVAKDQGIHKEGEEHYDQEGNNLSIDQVSDVDVGDNENAFLGSYGPV
jgi:hypothetical protein